MNLIRLVFRIRVHVRGSSRPIWLAGAGFKLLRAANHGGRALARSQEIFLLSVFRKQKTRSFLATPDLPISLQKNLEPHGGAWSRYDSFCDSSCVSAALGEESLGTAGAAAKAVMKSLAALPNAVRRIVSVPYVVQRTRGGDKVLAALHLADAKQLGRGQAAAGKPSARMRRSERIAKRLVNAG